MLQCIAACRAKVALLQSQRGDDDGGAFQKQLELSAAKRLGSHYLMRYFLLVSFRTWLQMWLEKEAAGGPCAPSFSEWFERRKELAHLLNTCSISA
jgi:hypothetical protein